MVVLAILAFLGVALGRGELDPSGTKSVQEEERPGGAVERSSSRAEEECSRAEQQERI
jgi:hypothetical protein